VKRTADRHKREGRGRANSVATKTKQNNAKLNTI